MLTASEQTGGRRTLTVRCSPNPFTIPAGRPMGDAPVTAWHSLTTCPTCRGDHP